MRSFFVVMLCMLALMGCGAADSANQPNAPTTAPTTAPTEVVAQPTQPPVSDPIVLRARAALAAQLGVAAETLSVQQVEPQEWNNSALGCADPSQAYMQVIVPGMRIVLNDGARSYDVHTNSEGTPLIWCEGGAPTVLQGGE